MPKAMECHHKPRTHANEAYCNARKKCGHPCDNWAGAGTDHKGIGCCSAHLGNARTHHGPKLAQQQASKFLRDYGVTPIDDPIVALQQLTSEAQSFYRFVSEHVASIDVDAWAGEEGKLSAYVALLERAQAQAQRFLSDWVRLGLEERLVRLSEKQAEAIGRVIDGVLNSLGLDDETLAKARGELPRQLRLVSRAS
jgi:hypothetical protein